MPFAIIIFLYIQDLFIKHTRPKLMARIFLYGVPANPCDSLSIPWILVAFSFGQFAITKTLSRSYFLSTNPTKFLLLTWPSWCWRHLSLREMLFTLPTRPTANTRRRQVMPSYGNSYRTLSSLLSMRQLRQLLNGLMIIMMSPENDDNILSLPSPVNYNPAKLYF